MSAKGTAVTGRRVSNLFARGAARVPFDRADPARFDALFLRHYSAVSGLLRRLLGSETAAEDAAQEVFLRLYRQATIPADEAELWRWLARVATNVGLNVLRSDRRHLTRLQRAAILDRAEVTGREDQQDPALTALAHEEAALVWRALADLAERPRLCLILRHSGLSYAEIATALGVAPGSVGTILARAERTFRQRYLALTADTRTVAPAVEERR